MKRFHVHVAVEDLAANIEFYSKLFGRAPAKQRPDYAKWMLDDPRINFAISTRAGAAGLDHFGMQAETPEELASLRSLAEAASAGATLDQGSVSCCYAQSEKHWTVDPQGLAWEHFQTTADAQDYGEQPRKESACCIPVRAGDPAPPNGQVACCIPVETGEPAAACCP